MKRYKILIVAIVVLLLPAVYFGWERHWARQHPLGNRPELFSYKITTHDPSLKGYLLLTPFQPTLPSNGSLVIMNMDGAICYQKNIGHPSYDFQQWNLNGRIFYSYITNDLKAYHVPGIKVPAGHVVILDSAMNEIRQVHLMPHGDITTARHEDLDLHEFMMLSPNHFITIAAYEKRVDNIPDSLHPSRLAKVVAPVIQETVNDSVVWQWDASRYPELYASSRERNHFSDSVFAQDYLHINGFFVDPRDSNLICSFRSSNQLVKVDRKNGNITWKLGGVNSDFPMTEKQKFLRQHNPTLIDNNETLLLFDNGDSIKRKSSQIMEFRLDERNRKILSFRAVSVPGPTALFMGLVQTDGANYFMSTGTGNSIFEIDRTNGEKRFEMHLNQLSYRVYKVDSIYGLERRK